VPDLVPGAQVFVPLDLTSTEGRDAREIEAIGLLAADATLAQVEAELEGLGRAAAGRHPSDNAGWSLRAADLKSSILGPVVPRMMWVQFGAAALFGLLACVNVAGLLLARGTARRGELSVRAALGASRGRLVRQLLVESALLAAVGAMAGLTLTAGALAAVRRLGPSTVPRLADVRLDGPVLLFTLALSALVVLGFGLAPAIEGARVGLQERLRQGTRPVTSRTRGRSALVAAQAAIAMTLLVGAGLLFKSFLTLSAVDPGFDPARLLVVRPVLAGAGWPDGRLVPFVSDLSDRLGRLPRVEAAGATNVAPLGTWSSAIRYRRADRSPDAPLLQANWRTVTPGFFRAMGLRLLSGRLLDERDTAEAPEVVVVTDSLAMRTWPGEDPLGRQIVWGRTGPPKTVVGVVSDLRDHFLDREAQPTMFRAFPQLPWSDVTFIVRAGSDPGSLVAEVRRAVQEAAPDVGVRIEPAERLVSNVLLQPRVNTMVFSAFALLALVLAAVGLYGLVSYTVRLRQRETAIRVALGAQPASLLWTLLRHATLLVLVGGVAGLAGGVALSRSLAALLYDTSPGDPFAYGLMFLVLAIVSLLAALGPARRALGVDPVAVLRHE
jgi:putative ABC transport system permease protein